MSVYTTNDGELCCPLCGDSNTHVDRVAAAARPAGEDGRIVEFTVDHRGYLGVDTEGATPRSTQVGEGRRHRFALLGWCECCAGRFALVFTQHKGVTLVESMDVSVRADMDGAA